MSDAYPAQPPAQYYARGPLQMLYTYNYGPFSNAFNVSTYDSRMTFLMHPEKVLENGYTAFSAALWFHMTPQSPKPSMHDVMSGFYTPNEVD